MSYDCAKLKVFESVYIFISEWGYIVPGIFGVSLKVSCVTRMCNSWYYGWLEGNICRPGHQCKVHMIKVDIPSANYNNF